MIPLLQVGTIVLFRVASLFIVAPVFSNRNIPPSVRAAFSLVLTLALMAVVPVPGAPIPLPRWAALLAVGATVGVLQGLLFAAVLIGLQMVGDIFDMGVGISMASAIDPTDSTSHAVFGRIFGVFGWAAFLALDGHLVIVRSLIDSLVNLPPYVDGIPHFLIASTIDGLCAATTIAWRLGAPLLGLLMLLDVMTGMLSRTVPQLQVMQFSFGAKQMLAILALTLFFGGMAEAAARQIVALEHLLGV